MKRTIKQKSGRVKQGLAMLLGLICLIPLPVFGMDTLTETEMDLVTGKAGVSVGFAETFNIARFTFDKFYWGDADSYRDLYGWGFIIVSSTTASGSGTASSEISLSVDQGGMATLDSATTGDSVFTTKGLNIPANTTFFALSANAPEGGKGLKVHLNTNDRIVLGEGIWSPGSPDHCENTPVPHRLGEIGIDDIAVGVVGDEGFTANMSIWTEQQ